MRGGKCEGKEDGLRSEKYEGMCKVGRTGTGIVRERNEERGK